MREERDAEREKLWETHNPWKPGAPKEPNVINSYLDSPGYVRVFIKELYDMCITTRFDAL